MTLLWLGRVSKLPLLSKITLLPFGRDVTLRNVRSAFALPSLAGAKKRGRQTQGTVHHYNPTKGRRVGRGKSVWHKGLIFSRHDNGTAVRVYGGNTFTVTATGGLVISEIDFTFGTSGNSNPSPPARAATPELFGLAVPPTGIIKLKGENTHTPVFDHPSKED